MSNYVARVSMSTRFEPCDAAIVASKTAIKTVAEMNLEIQMIARPPSECVPLNNAHNSIQDAVKCQDPSCSLPKH